MPQGKAAQFSVLLRGHMGAQGETIRGLGRKIDPVEPERGRQRVQRHLRGKHYPADATRRIYERALKLPVGALDVPGGEDDGEDEDLLSRLARARRELRALERALRVTIAAELREASAA